MNWKKYCYITFMVILFTRNQNMNVLQHNNNIISNNISFKKSQIDFKRIPILAGLTISSHSLLLEQTIFYGSKDSTNVNQQPIINTTSTYNEEYDIS
ncbi:MAG: hypothetical protein ACW97X_10645 [Candidatus Hodarchaeales archaeon]